MYSVNRALLENRLLLFIGIEKERVCIAPFSKISKIDISE